MSWLRDMIANDADLSKLEAWVIRILVAVFTQIIVLGVAGKVTSQVLDEVDGLTVTVTLQRKPKGA